MDFELIWFFVIFGVILLLTYYTSRFLASKTGKVLNGKYIKVIETLSMGGDKRLYLIKAGNEFILLASEGKSLKYLRSIEIDNYRPETQKSNLLNFEGFRDIFKNTIKKYNHHKSEGKSIPLDNESVNKNWDENK